MKRYTAIRVAIGLVMLQSAFSILHFVCWLLFNQDGLTAVVDAYPWTRMALLVAGLCWSIVSLTAIVSFRAGNAKGRRAYAYGAVAWIVIAFLLAPWPVALSGAIMPLLIASVLNTRHAGGYVSNAVALRSRKSGRDRRAYVGWVVLTALYYEMFFVQLTNGGVLAALTSDRSRGFLILAMPVAVFAVVLLTPKGQRLWRLGMFLMISGIAGFFALGGYVPYTRLVSAHLGTGYQGYAIPWELSTVWVVLLLLGGLVMLGLVRLIGRRRKNVEVTTAVA